MSIISQVDDSLKAQGVIDKTDSNNPVYVIKYQNTEYKVSMLAVQQDKRDWMADQMSRMFKAIIANAEEKGAVDKMKSIHNVLGIR